MDIHPFYRRKDEILNDLKKSKGLTLADMARSLNVTHSTLNSGFRNRRELPTLKNVMYLAEYTGCSLDYLIYGTGYKPIDPVIMKIVKILEEIKEEDPESLILAEKLIGTLKKSDKFYIQPKSEEEINHNPIIEEILELLKDQKIEVIESSLEGVRASIDFYGDNGKKENSGTA